MEQWTICGVPMVQDLRADDKIIHIHPILLSNLLHKFTPEQIEEIFKITKSS